MTPVRKRVLVSGKVQNVWFRQSCLEEARSRSIGGWARNLPDGRVEAVFEGESQLVEEMVAWCGQGSARAEVSHVEVTSEEPMGEKTFSIG